MKTLDGKKVAFLELFFDLVFVFAITQLVSRLVAEQTFASWWRTVLLAALIWWAWSLYTWMANAIDVEIPSVRMVMLAVTGTTFFIGHAVPVAFGDDGEWFSVPYFIVRVVALGLYWHGLRERTSEQRALLSFLPLAAIAPTIVLIGGFVDSDYRPWVWVFALGLDFLAAINAGRENVRDSPTAFTVNPAHFAERHGLFVIIAFGETIIVIGAATADVGRDSEFLMSAAVGLIGVFTLWWSYFDWINRAAERWLLITSEDETPRMARDLFTWLHFPIVMGILFYAVAVEEIVHHPGEPLEPFGRWALALAFVLFLGGIVGGHIRATGHLLIERAVAVVCIALVVVLLGPSASGLTVLSICVVVTIVALTTERARRSAPALQITDN